MWHDWGVWFRLGIPGVIMVGLEWWICEAGSLTAGKFHLIIRASGG